MAEPGQLEVKASRKKAFSAVYVNRFGKHVSGSVIELAGKSPRQAEKRRADARTPGAVRSPGGSAAPVAAAGAKKPPLKTAVKSRSRSTLASFKPPESVKSPVLLPGQADVEIQIQNSGLSAKNGTAGKADVFKFPVSVDSDATNGKKRNNNTFGKKREVFRVIYKMLHENENLRTRLLNSSHNSTVDVPTITNNKDFATALVNIQALENLDVQISEQLPPHRYQTPKPITLFTFTSMYLYC
ncbi:uncharacterized protein LOC144600064 [Rhinoraja longicauda]